MTLPKISHRFIALIRIPSSSTQITPSHIAYMCAVIAGPSDKNADVVSPLQICITESSDFRGPGGNATDATCGNYWILLANNLR